MSLFLFLSVTTIVVLLQILGLKRILKFAIFILYGIFAVLYLKLSFNPSVNTFTNAEKHTISAEGYIFNKQLPLYQYIPDNDSLNTTDNSLLGSAHGGFEIVKKNQFDEATFLLTNFHKPFYIKDNDAFILKNKIGNTSINNKLNLHFDEKEELAIKWNDSHPYVVASYRKDSTITNFELNNIKDKNYLSYGYPLRDYILNNIAIDSITDFANYQNLKLKLEDLSSFFLLRESKGDSNSNLALSGHLNTQLISSIAIDGQNVTSLANYYEFSFPDTDTLVFSLNYIPRKPELYKLMPDLKESNYFLLKDLNLNWFPLYSNQTAEDIRMFLTSNPQTVVKTVFDKGIRISGNGDPNSYTSSDASIGYGQGYSNSPLKIEILDHHFTNTKWTQRQNHIIESEEFFALNTELNTKSEEAKIFRLFKLQNLENRSVFRPQITLPIFIGIFIILSLTLGLQWMGKTKIKPNPKLIVQYFSPIFTVILAFIAIKLFLLWRTTVFLPISDIDQVLYDNFNNPRYLAGILIPLVVFLLMVWWRIFNLKERFSSFKIVKGSIGGLKKKHLGYIYITLILILIIRGMEIHKTITILDRFSAIYFPVIFYYLSYYIIRFRGKRNELLYPVLSINFIIFSIFFLMADAGFTVIFCLTAILMELTVLFNSTYHYKSLNLIQFLTRKEFILLWGLFILILFFSNSIVSLIFNYLKESIIIIACSILIIIEAYLFLKRDIVLQLRQYFFYDINPIFKRKIISKSNSLQLIAIIFPVLICGGVIFKSDSLSEQANNKYIHIKYRAQTLVSEVKDIIQNEPYGTYSSNKIVETATNKWFLSYFLEKGSEIPLISFVKPYDLQKHFRHGVTYITQTTDVMVSRYIIGEHGKVIPVLLSNLLLILFFYYLTMSPIYHREHRDSKKISLSLLSSLGLGFLTITAFFVFMTVTNKFIFFGQDFPFLSLQSIVSSVFFFTVFSLVVLYFIPKENERLIPYTYNPPKKFLNRLLSASILILFWTIPYLIYKNNYKDTFELSEVFEKPSEDFREVNNILLAQQSIKKDQGLPENLDSLFKDIRIDTKSEYSKTLLQHVVDELRKVGHNNIFEINASRTLGPVILKENRDRQLEIKIENNFYDLPSPDALANRWRGSLVAKDIDKASTITDISDLDKVRTVNHQFDKIFKINDKIAGNVEFHVIDGSWFVDETHDVVVVDLSSGTERGRIGTFNILRANEPIHPAELTSLATRLFDQDIIQIEEGSAKRQYFYSVENIKYFAKNLWINGDHRHFYPLEDKFLLAYNIVENLKSDPDLKSYPINEENVELTIDYELFQGLQDILNKNLAGAGAKLRGNPKYNEVLKSMDMNLIVATGDGEIVALNDAKNKPKDLLFNPNDSESMYNTRLRLTSKFDSKDEEKIFGNNNLLRLQGGPASTFKPLLFTTVSSGYNFEWEKLFYKPISKKEPSYFKDKNGNDRYRLYSNKSPYSLSLMDSDNIGQVDKYNYLLKSLNSYNTLVATLGSYTRDDLEKMDNNRVGAYTEFFKSFDIKNEEFPAFTFRGKNFTFNIKVIGENSFDFENKNSILSQKFYENYHLKTRYEDSDTQWLLPFQKGKSAVTWVKAVKSHFYMSDRIDPTNAIAQVVAGAYPVEASPYKMTEMFGKLFSGNRSFKLNLGDFSKKQYQRYNQPQPLEFSIDHSWPAQDHWYRFLSKDVFSPLGQVPYKGTAAAFGPLIKNKYKSKYYFYAKTGTGGANRFQEFKNIRNRHFVLIISKERLDNRGDLDFEALQNNKFLVLYFSIHNVISNQYWKEKADMVDEILQSKTVQHYFSSNNL